MGISFRLTLYGADEAAANKAARSAFDRIDRLNGLFSDYDSGSELMRLCRESGPGRPVQVSPELYDVLCRSLELSGRSEGAFDVTVGPVVRLWRRARRRKQLPDPDRLAETLRLVGYRQVRLNPAERSVELLQAGMRLDLGGIAKGYAADEALGELRRHGLSRALIDAGGDIVAGDPPPGKAGWRIGIAGLNADAEPTRFLIVANAAVATSGDAAQFVEIDGVRYSHIIDPRTGIGLTRRNSVTVVARDGITADGLASAVSVLGPEKGLRLIDCTPRTAALIETIADDGKRTTLTSRHWPAARNGLAVTAEEGHVSNP